MGGSCSANGEKRNAYRLLVGKPEGKRPLGRPRRRWVDNIRMDLGEVGWDGVDIPCICLHMGPFLQFISGIRLCFTTKEAVLYTAS
jgi:hypothetical protein